MEDGTIRAMKSLVMFYTVCYQATRQTWHGLCASVKQVLHG